MRRKEADRRKRDTKPTTVTEQTPESKDTAVVHVESAKITDAIRYPQVTEAPGELIMEYMNQSLEALSLIHIFARPSSMKTSLPVRLYPVWSISRSARFRP